MDVDVVDSTGVTLEGFEQGPVGGTEEGEGRVVRGCDEMSGRGEVKGCY